MCCDMVTCLELWEHSGLQLAWTVHVPTPRLDTVDTLTTSERPGCQDHRRHSLDTLDTSTPVSTDTPSTLFWGTDRLLTRPKGAHTRPLTSHRLDPVGRHRDNPANGTKTQSHSTVGRPRRRERQGGRVGGVGLEGEDVVDKVLLIMLGSSPPRRSIRAGEGGGLGQR